MENISSDPPSDSIPVVSDNHYKNGVNISSDKSIEEFAECNRSITQLFISTKPKELDFQSTCINSHDELLNSLLHPKVSISNSLCSGLCSFCIFSLRKLIYHLRTFVLIFMLIVFSFLL